MGSADGDDGSGGTVCGDKETVADLGYALEVNGQIKDKKRKHHFTFRLQESCPRTNLRRP